MLNTKILLMIVLTSSTFAVPPDLAPTQIAQEILDSSTGDRGYYHYMKASVNPEGTKIAFSPNIINANFPPSKTNLAANLKVFDIGSDFTLFNKQEFSITPNLISTSSFFGTDIVLILDFENQSVKFVKVGATLTQEGSDFTGFSDFPSYTTFAVKKEKNIFVANQVSGTYSTEFQFVKVDGNTNPRFPSGSVMGFPSWDQVLFGEQSLKLHAVVEFNPTETSTELIVAGVKILIVDTTKFADYGQDLDACSAIKITFDTITEFPNGGTIYGLIYNTEDTTKFLSSIKDTGNSIMSYLNNEGSAVTQLGFVDKTTLSLTGVAFAKGLNLLTTNYFLVNLGVVTTTDSLALETLIDPNAKLILVDVGTIDGDGKMDHKVVGDEIVPSGETNPFVISMEYINPKKGVIIFTGGIDADTSNKGWYKIIKLGEHLLPELCHEDCETCNTKSTNPSPHDCLSCKDPNIKIFGTSGCKCHENCLSCSENQNEKKCTICKDSEFYLDNGECLNGIEIKADLEETNEKIKTLEELVKNIPEDDNQNLVIAMHEETCGSHKIPGCLKCHENVSNGCKTCQRGAGIENKDGVDYCIICPFKNCEECSMTDHGRQCQKCFEGVIFDSLTQTCFGNRLFNLWISLFLVVGLVFELI